MREVLLLVWVSLFHVPRSARVSCPDARLRRLLARIVRLVRGSEVILTDERPDLVVLGSCDRHVDDVPSIALDGWRVVSSGTPAYWSGYVIDGRHDPERTIRMFDEVSSTYDRATRTLSLFQDARWKRHLASFARLQPSDVVVDLGCGTGDFLELLRPRSGVGVDVSPEMLRRARDRLGTAYELLCQGADEPLPPSDHVFVGYLLRNVSNFEVVLRNVHASLPSGGGLYVLEMFRPTRWARARLAVMRAWFGLNDVALGHRDGAYAYITESIERFVTLDDFCRVARAVGFDLVRVESRLFGAAHLVHLQRT